MSLLSRSDGRGTAPLGVKTICVLAAIVAIVAFFQGVYYLWKPSDMHTLIGGVLVVGAVIELAVAWGLWTLRPWSWYVAIGLFGLATVFAVYRILLQGDAVAVVEFLVDLTVSVYIYHKRDLYTPGTEARHDALHDSGVLSDVDIVDSLRVGETAPLGMKVIVGIGWLASLVAFFQGVVYVWKPSGDATVLGFLLVLGAIAQAYVLLGLWRVERWSWFVGLLLFGAATVAALFRVFLFGDVVAVAEFFVNALIAWYVYRKKDVYAPNVRVDLTPR